MSEDLLKSLANPALQDFIHIHENDDEQDLILRGKTIFDVPAPLVADQIRGRRKAKTKLPLFYKTAGIIFPPGKNLEQSSSEETARFKSTLINPGECFADLTAGLGIDTFFLSKFFAEAHYVEQMPDLLAIAKHNHQQLGSQHIFYHLDSCEHFLNETKKIFDLVYIDPSRRTGGDQKVFRLRDCTPDITALLPLIFRKTNTVLIKVSPLLDIQQGTKELSAVEKIVVVSVGNECKELLFFCRKNVVEEALIETINILPNESQQFHFRLSDEKNEVCTFSDARAYLYEPNVSILKAGAFKSIASAFGLFKISPSTHLYTSENFVEKFPGRVFKATTLLKPDEKAKKHIPEGKANVITRNYPLNPEQLKKKMKLTDGGQQYIIGFSGVTEKFVLLAERIK